MKKIKHILMTIALVFGVILLVKPMSSMAKEPANTATNEDLKDAIEIELGKEYTIKYDAKKDNVTWFKFKTEKDDQFEINLEHGNNDALFGVKIFSMSSNKSITFEGTLTKSSEGLKNGDIRYIRSYNRFNTFYFCVYSENDISGNTVFTFKDHRDVTSIDECLSSQVVAGIGVCTLSCTMDDGGKENVLVPITPEKLFGYDDYSNAFFVSQDSETISKLAENKSGTVDIKIISVGSTSKNVVVNKTTIEDFNKTNQTEIKIGDVIQPTSKINCYHFKNYKDIFVTFTEIGNELEDCEFVLLKSVNKQRDGKFRENDCCYLNYKNDYAQKLIKNCDYYFYIVTNKPGLKLQFGEAGFLAKPSRVELSPSISVMVNDAMDMSEKLKITPANATNYEVVWKSSNPAVATVSKSGKLVAKQSGKTTVSATILGKEYKCEVTVNKYNQSITGVKLGNKKYNSSNKKKNLITHKRVNKKTKIAKLSATAKTKITFAKKSGNKNITVAKNGKIYINKKLSRNIKSGKSKKFKVVITATAAADNTYNTATKNLTVYVKVK